MKEINKMQTIIKTYLPDGIHRTQFITLLGAIINWDHRNQNAVYVWDNGDNYQTTKEIEDVLKEYGFSYALPINYKEVRLYPKKEG